MEKKKNFFLFIISLMVLVFSCSDDPPEETMSTEALDFTAGMGLGINIGNTLDAINNSGAAPIGETGWGNPLITRQYIQALKGYGFTTIRLPVSWADYIDNNDNYKIADGRMNRVLEVAGWIVDEGFYCILNLHHDGGTSPNSWIHDFENNEEEIGDKFVRVWRQIAENVKDFSDLLILEAMNEVGFNSTAHTKADRYRKMNKLNQLFVDTVRATGSNNETRYLLISGFNTDVDQSVDPLFLMPTDTVKNRQILSIHYYTPSQFAIAGSQSSSFGFLADWGNPDDPRGPAQYNQLERQFKKIADRFVSKGIPIIIGEYNATRSNKVAEGRVRWITAVTRACLDNGMCPVLWDTGYEISRNPPYAMNSVFKTVWGENLGMPTELP